MKFTHLAFLLIFIPVVLISQSKYEITDLEIEGNSEISDSRIKNAILTEECSEWPIRVDPNSNLTGVEGFILNIISFGAEKIYLDSSKVYFDVDRIKQFYRANGFFQTSVSSQIKIDTTDNDAEVVFNITEGPSTSIEEFNLFGLDSISQSDYEDVSENLTIDTNSQYNEDLVVANQEIVLNTLGDKGRLFVTANEPEIKIDTFKNTANVDLNFSVGKNYKIKEIRIQKEGEGKDKVSNELLRSIVGIEPDDRFSFYDLQQGQIRLYRTNLFNSASVSAIRNDTTGNLVPLLINTNISSLYEVSPEIILNDLDGFNLGLGLGFTRKNFLGDARKLTISTSIAAKDPTWFLKNLSLNAANIYGYFDSRLTIEQPFLFNKPIYTKFETYYTHQKRKDLWNADIIGSKISFEFELPRYTYITSLRTYFNWESSKYIFTENYIKNAVNNFIRLTTQDTLSNSESDASDIISNIDPKPSTSNTILGVDIGVLKTDDFLFPTRGYKLDILLEDGNSIPYLFSEIGGYNYSSPSYYKILINSAWFLPVFDNSAFGFKLKIGNIHTYRGNQRNIPFNQRFYAGGSNSIRGWETRGLVPPAPIVDIENLSKEDFEALFLNNLAPGGFFLFESSLEIRTKLFGDFGGVVFIDYGNTWKDYRDMAINNIAVAVGTGIRYYSPIAPFRIDFGFKFVDPTSDENMFNRKFWDVFEFQIGIGEAF